MWLIAAVFVLVMWTGSGSIGIHLETIHHTGWGALLMVCISQLTGQVLDDRRELRNIERISRAHGFGPGEVLDTIELAARIREQHFLASQSKVHLPIVPSSHDETPR